MHAAAIRGLPSESGQPAAQAPASGRSVLSPACYLEASSPSPLPACHGKDPASRGPFSGEPRLLNCHHVAIDQLKSPGLGFCDDSESQTGSTISQRSGLGQS